MESAEYCFKFWTNSNNWLASYLMKMQNELWSCHGHYSLPSFEVLSFLWCRVRVRAICLWSMKWAFRKIESSEVEMRPGLLVCVLYRNEQSKQSTLDVCSFPRCLLSAVVEQIEGYAWPRRHAHTNVSGLTMGYDSKDRPHPVREGSLKTSPAARSWWFPPTSSPRYCN